MILDSSGLDLEQLARFVADAYMLDVTAIAFQPKGEASYSFIAVDRSGARWLIKVQDAAQTADQEVRLRAIRSMYAERGFTQVVAARQNRWGNCTCVYEQYTLSVYPFIEGETVEPGRQTDDYAYGLASLLGAVHQNASLPVRIPKETFETPFEPRIRLALQTVAGPERLANPVQERLRELMRAHRANILTTIDTMRQITAAVRQLDLDWVLTHGDPNWSNILVDPAGAFHLLDWDDLALGPPERDLVFFSDRSPERFEAFLRQYLAINPGPRLHADVFAFYHYRWTMQEIADYTERILFRSVDPAEAEHAWTELQPYVPAPHGVMAESIRQIETILARIYGAARGP